MNVRDNFYGLGLKFCMDGLLDVEPELEGVHGVIETIISTGIMDQ
jgi:hypothetical protein